MMIAVAGIICWAIVVLVVAYFLKGSKSCGGDCHQGRATCDCGNKDD